jgi:hypothetical protein
MADPAQVADAALVADPALVAGLASEALPRCDTASGATNLIAIWRVVAGAVA